MVNRGLLKSLLRMYSAMEIYSDLFEVPFIERTTQFYASESQRYMEQSEVPGYLVHVEKRLAEENSRVQHYLDPSSRKELIKVVERQLLEKHLDTIVDKGFNSLMEEHRIEDLARCYSLFNRVQGLYTLKASFNAYIKKTGLEKVSDTEKDDVLVQELLDYKQRLDDCLQKSFENSDDFSNSLKEGFEHFINARQNKPAELVAKFIDGKMRSGSAGLTEDALENLLDRVMVIFRFIQGKDIFEAFYKKYLAKRLLLGKSGSEDTEKAMISKLKQECGSAFTIKLEGMFKDMDISDDVITAYKEREIPADSKGGKSDIDLNVKVLTNGFWPTYPSINVTLPAEMTVLQDEFTDFYTKRHNGRRLTWQNTLGQCMVKANFPTGKRELQVSLFQAVVLLNFNDKDELTLKELAASTQIEEEELQRTVQSLSTSKTRILRQKGKEGEDADTYTYNGKFTAKVKRVKVDSIMVKETETENKETHQKVFQDRQYQVDAAIVRILKARKSMTHTLLIADIYGQVKFPLKPVDIKKRIESLIDREYIERDSANSQNYIYCP